MNGNLGMTKSKSTSITTQSWWRTRRPKETIDTYNVPHIKSDNAKGHTNTKENNTDVDKNTNCLMVYNVRNIFVIKIFANNYFFLYKFNL